jgi:Lrp/AsnC family transcriptional regulator, regulator for asnA, asnC and gidA
MKQNRKGPAKNLRKEVTTKGIDELDKKIILELQGDARASFKDIARKLRVSEGTARNRVMRLIGAGILKLQARVNPFAFSHKISALVGVNLKERHPEKQMEEIKKIPCVTSVWNATGRYDLFFEVMVDSLKELNEVLLKIDRDYVRGISQTETFITLSSDTKFFKLS